MDQSSAAQLNKAYGAFRQVYMEKQAEQKQFKQKIKEYEHHLKILQDENVECKNTISVLQSKLSASRGNMHGTECTQENMKEDSEKGLQKLARNEPPLTLPYDQLFEKLKMASQQEKYLKEELALERNKVKKMEEDSKVMKWRLESVICSKTKEINSLKQQLMGAARFVRPDMESLEEKYETSDKSTRITFNFPNSEISAKQDPSGEEMEDVFQELKGEFDRLRTLTRRQSAHLGKLELNIRNDEDQFSMPIQCTDVPPEQTEGPFQSSERKYNDSDMVTRITPRGPGQEEDYSCYVLPLDQLDIKFPPPPDHLDFLKSSTDKPVEIEAAVKTQQDSDLKLRRLKNSPAEASEIESNNIIPPVLPCDPPNKHLTDLNILTPTNMDKNQLSNSVGQIINIPIYKDDTTGTVSPTQAAETTVKGPQQALWKPFQNQNNETLAQGSNICEFCHAVFPPSSISTDEFFRHLFLHLQKPISDEL